MKKEKRIKLTLRWKWVDVMPALIAAIEQGQGSTDAKKELMRLAREVDKLNAKINDTTV